VTYLKQKQTWVKDLIGTKVSARLESICVTVHADNGLANVRSGTFNHTCRTYAHVVCDASREPDHTIRETGL